MSLPVDVKQFSRQEFDLSKPLSSDELDLLKKNIQLVRDTIVFFTAIASKRGFGGHTGGAYDLVPEALILQGFMNKESNNVYPVLFDEAGHRVALQYVMAVLNGHMDEEKLLHYREYNHGLYGHPEREDENGIFFSSGRLGHLWSHVNGVAEAHPEKKIVMLGSDGAQMEGNDAEAARYAAMRKLNVKLFIDDNNVTISGHPKDYMPGYSVEKTLDGMSIATDSCDGEDVEVLFEKIRSNLNCSGPAALISYRKMAPGIPGIEGTPKGHDVVPVDAALAYLNEKGYVEAVSYLEAVAKASAPKKYKGSSESWGKIRSDFGKVVAKEILAIPEKDRKDRVLVVDNDLEGSCGFNHLHDLVPEVFVQGGIMERNNFGVAAGFSSTGNRIGIYGTFSAFTEMVISELTMARLNNANMLVHFSHSGVDDMADNTCHFGINNFFLDNGLEEGDSTRLYFPADVNQLASMIPAIFEQKGIRFVFSTRSGVPAILKEDGSDYFGGSYSFTGKDEVIRDGKKVYIVSFGEMLYRSLDAVEKLREEGIDAALVNKPLLNVIDEDMMKCLAEADTVLVVESFNAKTGLGIRFGTWLLERGFKGNYAHLGSSKPGHGGLGEHIEYQGLAPDAIVAQVKSMM